MTTKSYTPVTKGVSWLLSEIMINSSYGRKEIQELKPFKAEDFQIAKKSFSELEAAKSFFSQDKAKLNSLFNHFKKLRNIYGTIQNLKTTSILDETEFLEIKGFAILSEKILEETSQMGFKASSISMVSLNSVIKLLNPEEKILPSFHLSESYSNSLGKIRAEKKSIEAKILNAKTEDDKKRYRAERSKIVQQEKEEEFNIRISLGNDLRKYLSEIENNASMLGKLELLLARTEIGLRWPSCEPDIQDLKSIESIEIKDLLNPEIYEILRSENKSFTPVNISIQKGVTLLTGANMGGKTVALSTIAMNMELLSIGFSPYARIFKSCLPDFIEFVSGDGQDQESGLSSFGAELMELHEFIAISKKGSGLAIFDEFARSTNPGEGKNFVQALCEFLQNSDSFGIVATHYDGVNLDGANYYQVVGLQDDSYTIETDQVNHSSYKKKIISGLSDKMDYSLKKIEGNYEVPKDALKIASILNLDEEFLEIIKKYYQ